MIATLGCMNGMGAPQLMSCSLTSAHKGWSYGLSLQRWVPEGMLSQMSARGICALASPNWLACYELIVPVTCYSQHPNIEVPLFLLVIQLH